MIDKDGRVHYSDKPSPGAEPVTGLGELPTVEAFKPPPRADNPAPVPAAVPYKRIAISSPAPDATLRENTGSVSVSVSLEPALQHRYGPLFRVSRPKIAGAAGCGRPFMRPILRYDEVTPAVVETVHRGIAGSQWVIFEESSHNSQVEETQRYLRVLEEFLDKVEAEA